MRISWIGFNFAVFVAAAKSQNRLCHIGMSNSSVLGPVSQELLSNVIVRDLSGPLRIVSSTGNPPRINISKTACISHRQKTSYRFRSHYVSKLMLS